MRLPKIAAFAALLVPAVASAHVRITSPTPRSTTVLKDRHCGATGLARANVHNAASGSTLHLVWDEYVQHPGWFRISFQQNGDTFEIPPPSNGKTGSGAAGNYPTEDLTGKTDGTTGSVILKDRIPDGTTSADIVLPNVECNNCTLQLIQMMTDKPSYDEKPGSNDIYFACVDLVLTRTGPSDAGPGGGPLDAGTSTDGGVATDAGGVGTGGPDGGVEGGGGGGGCNVADTGFAGGTFLALVTGLPLLRRRRAH